MRILFVNYEYPPLGGGGGIVNAWLAEELAKRHEVSVLTSRAFGLSEQDVVGNVEIIRSRTFFRPDRATANLPSMATFVMTGTVKGRKLLRNQRFDVINTHFALPTGPVGASLARYANLPNVLTVQGGDLYDPSKRTSPHRHALLRSVVRRVVQASDAVVAASQNSSENVRRYYDASAEPHLIPLGIPRPPKVSSGRTELGFDKNETILVTIGRLVSRKRNDHLIDVISRIGNENLRLVIIGDGPELADLEDQARRLGLIDKVTFAGFVSDQKKVDLLAAADLYVSCSQHEGFGLVFLEAMAQGLPIVCYDHGGQTDYLTHEVNGAVLPLDDADAFTSAVSDLVSHPDKRETIAAQNLADVERLFIDSCASGYEALFEEVIANSVAR